MCIRDRYIPYLDLAINFHVVLEVVGSRLISIPIYNDFLKMWNVDVETLMACARNNISSLLPHKFSTLESIIKDLSTGMPLPDVEDEPPAFVPVSYTHLDVYKRQRLSSGFSSSAL